MLISRQAESKSSRRQGSGRADLAELRRQLANPLAVGDGYRQRLLELARKLARVQALGNEYARVRFSQAALAALGPPVTA